MVRDVTTITTDFAPRMWRWLCKIQNQNRNIYTFLHESGEDSSLDFLQMQKVSFFYFCVLTIQRAYNINRKVTC